MAKRVTNIGVQVEYSYITNYIRTTNIGVNVEYSAIDHAVRVTSAGVSIEYIDKRRKYGPSTGMML